MKGLEDPKPMEEVQEVHGGTGWRNTQKLGMLKCLVRRREWPRWPMPLVLEVNRLVERTVLVQWYSPEKHGRAGWDANTLVVCEPRD